MNPAARCIALCLLAGLSFLHCGGGKPSPSETHPQAPAPVIIDFAATPKSIAPSQSSTLAWTVTGATSLSLDQSIGPVTGSSRPVSPGVTTTYTLTASNGSSLVSAQATVNVSSSTLPGSQAEGSVPAGLPARLAVGLMEEPGETWMKTSGVAWDLRYHYFVKGWRDNWGWDATNSGQWGLAWMKECDAQGCVPAVQFYCMNNEPGGGEGQFFAKTQNAATMASYFDDFKVLMQRCKEFGKPVLVMMEGDGFAYMEIQSGDNPDAPSAVASTGMAELQGLPNTAAGWGMAFLQIRKAVGATNVILGMHISGWATLKDISYSSVTDPLQPEVDKAYAFLSRLGLAANVTGQTFDVLVGDPLDRDSDYYALVMKDPNRWWDASDSAPIASRSFNRYAEWLRLWNLKARKRWVLWQIPLGNSNHLNVANSGQPRGGYKDNRPEYFFGGDTSHLRKFADVGVIALLFGAGADGQAMYQNDLYSDGDLFMKCHAGAFLKAGGLPIAR